MRVQWTILVVFALAGCSGTPDGKEWVVGETADMGEALPDGASGTAQPNNVTDPDPVLPRSGGAENEPCEVTFDCAAGLECADAAEFESPLELRCAAPECFCDSPETTYCFEGDCAIAGRNCVLDGCPDAYQCDGKVCRCDGDECQSGCQGDQHCGWDEICVEGGCRDARCETDEACPARYVCGAGQLDRLCRVAGTSAVGDDCSRDADCASGYCYDLVTCVQPCFENSECGDRECATPDHFDLAVPYCQAPRCAACDAFEYCRVDQCDTDPCPNGECDWEDF